MQNQSFDTKKAMSFLSKIFGISMIVGVLSSIQMGAAQEAHIVNEPKLGGTIQVSVQIKGYESAQTDFWSILNRKNVQIPAKQELVIIENLYNDSIWGDEVWIRVAPIDKGALNLDSAAWLKWSDRGAVSIELIDAYRPPNT